MANNRAPRTSSPPAPSAGPWGFLAERWELVTLGVLAIAPLVIPALGGALGGQVTNLFIYCILALALNVMVGYTGLVHLGIASFFGIGAYVLAILTVPMYPFQIGFLAAAVIAVWSPAVDSRLLRAVVTPLGVLAAFRGFLHPVLMYLSRAMAAGEIRASEVATLKRRLLQGAMLAGVALLAGTAVLLCAGVSYFGFLNTAEEVPPPAALTAQPENEELAVVCCAALRNATVSPPLQAGAAAAGALAACVEALKWHGAASPQCAEAACAAIRNAAGLRDNEAIAAQAGDVDVMRLLASLGAEAAVGG